MFSSRTLADRNSDPAPWLDLVTAGDKEEIRWGDVDWWGKMYYKYDPRPEFQYGALPENPILVAFREKNLDLSWFLNEYNHPTDYWVWEYGVEEVDHATRVLTLLSKIGANK